MQAAYRERKACHINKSLKKKVLVCAPILVCVLVCAKNSYVCSYVLLVFALVRAHVCAVVWLYVLPNLYERLNMHLYVIQNSYVHNIFCHFLGPPTLKSVQNSKGVAVGLIRAVGVSPNVQSF